MAPLRNNRSSNRSGRSQVDHDVFEGLPVRHWRKAPVAITTAPQKEEPAANTARQSLFIELAMPRDAQLLSTMSQDLLRAARSGEITKRAPPQPHQDDDKEGGEEDEPAGDVDSAFMARRWATVPRNQEGPEPEFLAKRRKGLPSAYTASVSQIVGATPMRKTKIKKFDNDGNASVLEVLVPEGQTVDGEVVEEEANITQAPAPGTIVEGLGVANAEGIIVAGDQVLPTPPRRRPPPPKRKAKGPGRGRKKKVAFATGAEGLHSGDPSAASTNGPDRLGVLDQGAQETSVANTDVVMGDDDTLHDGEESSEEDEDGDDAEEGDREDGELSASPAPSIHSPSKDPSVAEPSAHALREESPQTSDPMIENHLLEPTLKTSETNALKDASSSPDLPLAAGQEMTVLSNMSTPMDNRVMASRDDGQTVVVVEPSQDMEEPPADVRLAAEVPEEHNPLEGLVAPKTSKSRDLPLEQEPQILDAEVDLLGSLEQQLNRSETTVSNET
ncbi:MAG: hypothetical protein Q9220_005147 [cf. Caloplaca sp. 1 TL-2023]